MALLGGEDKKDVRRAERKNCRRAGTRLQLIGNPRRVAVALLPNEVLIDEHGGSRLVSRGHLLPIEVFA